MFIGLGILLVGIIFLLQNLGYIGGNVWQIIWPAIIIIAGLLIVFKPKFRSGIFDGKNKK